MSGESHFLALRLQGPLQSWGLDSDYSRRATGLFPTKSAIAGMCCAAQGFDRGSEKEREFLKRFNTCPMKTFLLPQSKDGRHREIGRMSDYHTVMGSVTADGKTKNCHITNRHFLSDAAFGVILEGPSDLLSQIGGALKNPVWGVWLGRKTCIPSAPVFAGLGPVESDVAKTLLGEQKMDFFPRQVETRGSGEGTDSLPDVALSFGTDKRAHSLRRVDTLRTPG